MTKTPIQETRFTLAPSVASELAARFGTPLYVVDEHHFRARIAEYLDGPQGVGTRTEVSFASKANSTLAILAIAYQAGCSIDVASEGELRAALLAGVPASRCHLHGNNKTTEEIEFAIESGIGHIVVDHLDEIRKISELLRAKQIASPKIVIRLAPGVDPITHEKISTGQSDTKFGFNIGNGAAEIATEECLRLRLDLIGFHCHVGSQLLDPEAQRSGGELITRFAVEMAERYGFVASYLNVGGGLAVRYTSDDQPTPVGEYCKLISDSVLEALHGSPLKAVTLGFEPGRSLIAESGVTLYRVGVIKTVPISEGRERTYVSVDGGLSDNPRPVMYGSKYTVRRVDQDEETPTKTYTVSGKHCETDRLFDNVELPEDLKVGDLLQVLSTGAYNSSMANNYNRYRRPGTALVRMDGSLALVQRPETWDEMFARENIPEDLNR